MKRLLVKAGIPLVIILVAIILAAVMIASRKPPETNEEPERAFLVEAKQVQQQNVQFSIASQGTVVPRIQTMLSTQVSGVVVSVSDTFIEGGMFKKGDVLLQLEQDDYLTEVKAAEADLARAQAALDEEIARSRVAEEEWRSVSSSAPPELGLRKPQLAREEANVKAAEARLERARRNLQRTTIRAPYDGLVRQVNVDLGQFVTTGTQLGLVFNTTVAEVRIPLTDSDLAFLRLPEHSEQQANVTLSTKIAGKNVNWQGKLVRSEGVLDERNRVIYAVVEVSDPYQRNENATGTPLRFGRFVNADIKGTSMDNLIVLPRNVLRLDGTVLVVEQDRTLRIQKVDIVRSDPEFVYIASGLEHNDMVTVSAVPNAYDGMKVRLPSDEPDTPEPADKDKPDNSTTIASAGDNV
ncbi:efflux RND transporter periplasmic adaptor subunit [Aestuariibacter salexigens]|uniref:efflux RND transporter periplasmic adaptor subunit n=1 Tax=Aestuariibacter salexigens TaxID=226010 RepID=UPI000423F644|nr:efflux RND transporter periplasmic adaptor subunit [Aestuariibacter salexigens]